MFFKKKAQNQNFKNNSCANCLRQTLTQLITNGFEAILICCVLISGLFNPDFSAKLRVCLINLLS